MLTFLAEALGRFSLGDAALLAVNVVLLLAARPVVHLLTRGDPEAERDKARIQVFRALNVSIIVFLIFRRVFLPVVDTSWPTKIIGALFILYLSYLGYHILAFLIRQRYGRAREVNGEKRFSETYNTRALSLLAGLLASIVALIGVVRTLGFDSLLETGGVIGFIGVMLALTQASWAPDIISGLIILNSKFMEEGDVIQIEGPRRPIVGVVFRIKMFHTEILNVQNNHRIMIKNASLREQMVRNLSKFASARGLREQLVFNVGYDVPGAEFEAMIETAYARACENKDLPITDTHGAECRVLDAGDYAVQWGVYFYVKEVRQIVSIRQALCRIIVDTAWEQGIQLATPQLHVMERSDPDDPEGSEGFGDALLENSAARQQDGGREQARDPRKDDA